MAIRSFEEFGIEQLKRAKTVEQVEENMNTSCLHCMRLHRNGGECLNESCPILRYYENRIETLKRHGGSEPKWRLAWVNPEYRGR